MESLVEMLQQGNPQNQVYSAQAMSKLALDTQACHALLAAGEDLLSSTQLTQCVRAVSSLPSCIVAQRSTDVDATPF